MRLFDWLAPRRRCVVMGCSREPNRRRGALCLQHELELDEKIKRAVERIRATHTGEHAR